MDEKAYLHTSKYPARRRRRGCGGCLILLLLACVGIFILSQTRITSNIPIPVFGHSVGVIRIEGPINESQHITKILKTYRESPLIKAVVIRLDTPGGAVGASEEVFREVRRIVEKAKKPVIASMGNAAASGGYYIAVATDEIYANQGTLTGSIGVIAMDWNVEPVLRKVGIKPEILKSGQHKDSGSPFRHMEPEDRAYLQNVVFDTYRQFFTTVLRSRHKQIRAALERQPSVIDEVVSPTATKRIGGLEWDAFTTGSVAAVVGTTTETETALRMLADGRILSGDQALRVGLIDHIGSLEDAIERAAQLAKLGKSPPVIERSPESAMPALLGATARSFWQEFIRGNSGIEFRAED